MYLKYCIISMSLSKDLVFEDNIFVLCDIHVCFCSIARTWVVPGPHKLHFWIFLTSQRLRFISVTYAMQTITDIYGFCLLVTCSVLKKIVKQIVLN